MRPFYFGSNSGKNKLSHFLIPVSLILLADGIMAYAFPIIVEDKLNSNTEMGIIMALSSVVGLVVDLIIPQIFKRRSWKPMLILGILSSMLFPLFTALGSDYYSIVLFLLASAVWGIYFEFIAFSQQDFIVSEEPRNYFSRDWGILSSVWDLTLIAAPIIGAYLIHRSNEEFAIVLLSLQFAALIFALLLLKSKKKKTEIVGDPKSEVAHFLKLVKQIKTLELLGERTFPLILLGFCLSFNHATYWTIGGLFGEEISENTEWLILILSSIALLLGESLIVRLKIGHRKKFTSQISVLIGSLMLCGFFLKPSETFIYILVFVSTFFIGFAHPLNEAVYSDLSKRSKEAEMVLLSISRMTVSLSYTVGPLLSGILSDKIGYENTFGVTGVICIVICIFLLFTTPKKIKLPQSQLNSL